MNVRLAPMSLKKIPTNDHYLLYVSLITFLNLSQSKPPIESLTFLLIQQQGPLFKYASSVDHKLAKPNLKLIEIFS